MIMTQEQLILKAQDQFEQVKAFVHQAHTEGRRIDEVESDLPAACLSCLPAGRRQAGGDQAQAQCGQAETIGAGDHLLGEQPVEHEI